MIGSQVGGNLAGLLRAGRFVVTGEVVPPLSGSSRSVIEQTRASIGYVDALNVTDNPVASARMSAVAAAGLVSASGAEPTLQLTVRDRNRLAITSDLLGAWALGARNVMCLSGDPIALGDHPEAAAVSDLSALDVVRLARRIRDEGVTMTGTEISDPPRYLIGVADMPLADQYDPSRLEEKLDAGADVVWTQIAYDVERLAAWAEVIRQRGIDQRARIIVGVVPLKSFKAATFMHDNLPGVTVPEAMLRALEKADDQRAAGLELTVEVMRGIAGIPEISGLHVMGMGDQSAAASVIEGAGFFPRPAAPRA